MFVDLCVCVYLCCIHFIEHYNGGAVVVKHQPPEVTHGIGQRMLSNYEGRWLFVALEW